MMIVYLLSLVLVAVDCGPATETYKDQYCTDPRTMRKHAAYTEWADAYSCTRHRCQPGGRNLAIYTVGCKRVEAPESAIECEEVVEDTNMQFPFCCTRLRCLVVVRGEVWTRVLGQPWEALPAAPWSHMYKMKKPPPTDGAFAPKTPDQGPVYELTDSESDGPREKVLRASNKKGSTEGPDYNEAVPRAVAAPDIVIALSTNSDPKDIKVGEALSRHKRIHKEVPRTNNFFEEERDRERDRDRDHTDTDAGDTDDTVVSTEKPLGPQDVNSDERFYANVYGVTQKAQQSKVQPHQQAWTEIPQNQWNEHDPGLETDSNRENPYNQQDFAPEHKVEPEKPSNLQALVDAIGSRMKDIEHVVQRMSEKVHQPREEGNDKGFVPEEESGHKRHKSEPKEYAKTKKPGPDDHYKRFSVRNRSSKYLHTLETTTEPPLFVEDTKMNGYFSDASNSIVRRANEPKEPVQTYMAPVETRRKTSHSADASDEKKRKKHQHKKKKGKHHKKHHNKKKFNRLSSAEIDKNVVSLEDSSAAGGT